jgi:hypothetical protein
MSSPYPCGNEHPDFLNTVTNVVLLIAQTYMPKVVHYSLPALFCTLPILLASHVHGAYLISFERFQESTLIPCSGDQL